MISLTIKTVIGTYQCIKKRPHDYEDFSARIDPHVMSVEQSECEPMWVTDDDRR